MEWVCLCACQCCQSYSFISTSMPHAPFPTLLLSLEVGGGVGSLEEVEACGNEKGKFWGMLSVVAVIKI